MSRRALSFVLLALTFAGCGSDSTGPNDGPLPPGLNLTLQPFVPAGLNAPVFLTQPLDDGRIFVVEQAGRIRVVRDGSLLTTPFLDLTGTNTRVGTGGERGMLSVAFHPQYATNRYFYVYFTALNGDIRIERFTTTANPEVADPSTARLIITAPHSQNTNHNGGLVTFGPDGMLWTAFGDGGGAGDPLGNGQNFNSLLGSMIRINVNSGDPYAIPPDNPFVGQAGRRGEIWAKGLRNPWRFAFDAPTGMLYIADVGQSQREEVNAEPYPDGGINYGWNITEGSSCYTPALCETPGLTGPKLEYTHAEGCSVTGGYVYRGSAIPGLQGHYLYADYCNRWIGSFRYSNGTAVDRKVWDVTSPGNVSSFGVDYDGDMYVIGGSVIYRIVAESSAL